MIVGCPSSVMRRQQLLKRTSPHKILAGLLRNRNDNYMAIFDNCSNGFISRSHRLKFIFKMKTF